MSFLTSQKYTIKKNGKSLFSIRDMVEVLNQEELVFLQRKETIKWIEKFKKILLLLMLGPI